MEFDLKNENSFPVCSHVIRQTELLAEMLLVWEIKSDLFSLNFHHCNPSCSRCNRIPKYDTTGKLWLSF